MLTGVTFVLAVGDLYQLPPVGQSAIYKPPEMIQFKQLCSQWMGKNETT